MWVEQVAKAPYIFFVFLFLFSVLQKMNKNTENKKLKTEGWVVRLGVGSGCWVLGAGVGYWGVWVVVCWFGVGLFV